MPGAPATAMAATLRDYLAADLVRANRTRLEARLAEHGFGHLLAGA